MSHRSSFHGLWPSVDWIDDVFMDFDEASNDWIDDVFTDFDDQSLSINSFDTFF